MEVNGTIISATAKDESNVSAEWKAAQHELLLPESNIYIEMYLANGDVLCFDKSDIISYSHSRSVDLVAGAIPTNKATFSIRNEEHQWDRWPDAVLQAAKVKISYGMIAENDDWEWIKGASLYLSEWHIPNNGLEASFTATSGIQYLQEPEQIMYRVEQSSVGGQSPVGTVVAEIVAWSIVHPEMPYLKMYKGNLSQTVEWLFDPDLLGAYTAPDMIANNIKLTVPQCLQLVANATQCCLWDDRDGDTHLQRISRALKDVRLDLARSWMFPEYDAVAMISGIDVTYTGGTTNVPLSVYGKTQTVKNPMISTSAQAVEVGTWVANTLAGRRTAKCSVRPDVRLNPLDQVFIENRTGDDSSMIVTDVNLTFSGTWKGEITGRMVDDNGGAGYGGEHYLLAGGDIIPTLEEGEGT